MRNRSSSCCRQHRSGPASCHRIQLTHFQRLVTSVHNCCNTASYAEFHLLLDCTVAPNAIEHDAQHVARQRPAAAGGPPSQSWGNPAASPPAAAALRASPAPRPPLHADMVPLPHITDQTAATSKLALLVDASACCWTKSQLYWRHSVSRILQSDSSLYASSSGGVSNHRPSRRRASPSAPP